MVAMTVEPGETRTQRKERERAERAEWDYLTSRLSILWPNYDCFCGTLDDLRRTVADLERRQARVRPPRSSASEGVVARDADPTTSAKLAVARAAGRLSDDGETAGQHRPSSPTRSVDHAEFGSFDADAG